MEFYSKNINLYAVRKVTNVQFKEDDEEIMKRLFKNAQKVGSFKIYYEDILDQALT